MRPQPAAGRYFAIEPARLIELTRDWPLEEAFSNPRQMLNPKHREPMQHLLVRLRPGRDVTIFSLPASLDVALGERAVVTALALLGRWKSEREAARRFPSRSILVRLHDEKHLTVSDERVKFTRVRLKVPGEGLGSRQPTVASRTITELATVTLD